MEEQDGVRIYLLAVEDAKEAASAGEMEKIEAKHAEEIELDWLKPDYRQERILRTPTIRTQASQLRSAKKPLQASTGCPKHTR